MSKFPNKFTIFACKHFFASSFRSSWSPASSVAAVPVTSSETSEDSKLIEIHPFILSSMWKYCMLVVLGECPHYRLGVWKTDGKETIEDPDNIDLHQVLSASRSNCREGTTILLLALVVIFLRYEKFIEYFRFFMPLKGSTHRDGTSWTINGNEQKS